MVESINPPRWILFLLWPFKGESCYPQIVGDLSEEFHQRLGKNGISTASRWYYREVYRNLWSMILRWVTIPVIIVPLLCLRFGLPLQYRLHSYLTPFWWPFLWELFANLLFASIFGLALGIISSRILRRHERMVRVVFGVYYLRYLVFMLQIKATIHSNLMDTQSVDYSSAMQYFLITFYTLICIWIGSILIERHHHRRRVA